MAYRYRKSKYTKKSRRRRRKKFEPAINEVNKIKIIRSLDDDGRFFVILQLPGRFSG